MSECLMPNEQFVSNIMSRTSYILSAKSCREQVTFWWDDDNDVRFVLDQHVELGFYCAGSLK
jgi:hypothetical protein